MNTTRTVASWTVPTVSGGRAITALRAARRASHARRADRRATARTIAAYPASRGVAMTVPADARAVG